MSARYEQERALVAVHLPSNTRYTMQQGRNVWVFEKGTELGQPFVIAIYFDPDENGYSAQLISPEIEQEWHNPHIGHIFHDGVICLGGPPDQWRAAPNMLEVYAKACLWAEGIAVMMVSKRLGQASEFPFSNNNSPGEVS